MRVTKPQTGYSEVLKPWWQRHHNLSFLASRNNHEKPAQDHQAVICLNWSQKMWCTVSSLSRDTFNTDLRNKCTKLCFHHFQLFLNCSDSKVKIIQLRCLIFWILSDMPVRCFKDSDQSFERSDCKNIIRHFCFNHKFWILTLCDTKLIKKKIGQVLGFLLYFEKRNKTLHFTTFLMIQYKCVLSLATLCHSLSH